MIILDLDNCACDDSHRLHILRRPVRTMDVWNEYHRLCDRDIAVNHEVWFDRSDIIVMTGRTSTFRDKTLHWCHINGLRVQRLFMRPEDDFTGSVEMKRSWVKQLLNDGVHFDHAYDDREDIVDMYRTYSIPAIVLRAHSKVWV